MENEFSLLIRDLGSVVSSLEAEYKELQNITEKQVKEIELLKSLIDEKDSIINSLKQSLSKAKAKIEAELEEARFDIDEVLDSITHEQAQIPTTSTTYTAVEFSEITRYLAGSNINIDDVIGSAILYQDKELTFPSPNEGQLTLNNKTYGTDGDGVIHLK